jgi:hypothetical protein
VCLSARATFEAEVISGEMVMSGGFAAGEGRWVGLAIVEGQWSS